MSALTHTRATSPCEICWADVATHLYALHREWHRAQVDGHGALEERMLRKATTAATDIVRERLGALAETARTSA